MTRRVPLPARRSFSRVLVVAVVLALVGAASWWAWLGWDHAYYEVDGVAQGPYRAWQVVGCGACVLAATVVARLRATHASGLLLLPAAAVAGFAWPWSVDAASTDETGMWGVGLLMILVGGGLGLLAVLAVVEVVRDSLEPCRVPNP